MKTVVSNLQASIQKKAQQNLTNNCARIRRAFFSFSKEEYEEKTRIDICNVFSYKERQRVVKNSNMYNWVCGRWKWIFISNFVYSVFYDGDMVY